MYLTLKQLSCSVYLHRLTYLSTLTYRLRKQQMRLTSSKFVTPVSCWGAKTTTLQLLTRIWYASAHKAGHRLNVTTWLNRWLDSVCTAEAVVTSRAKLASIDVCSGINGGETYLYHLAVCIPRLLLNIGCFHSPSSSVLLQVSVSSLSSFSTINVQPISNNSTLISPPFEINRNRLCARCYAVQQQHRHLVAGESHSRRRLHWWI